MVIVGKEAEWTLAKLGYLSLGVLPYGSLAERKSGCGGVTFLDYVRSRFGFGHLSRMNSGESSSCPFGMFMLGDKEYITIG